jgi:hypothetical protein
MYAAGELLTSMELVSRRIEAAMRQQEWRDAMMVQRWQFGQLLAKLSCWRNAVWQTAPASFHQQQGFMHMVQGALSSFYGDDAVELDNS